MMARLAHPTHSVAATAEVGVVAMAARGLSAVFPVVEGAVAAQLTEQMPVIVVLAQTAK
jgi:hypothetical protein